MFPLVMCTDCGPMTRIENLTLTVPEGGMAFPVARGGGVNIMNASPIFSNVIISGFEADYGGGVYIGDGSSPQFLNCSFEGNYARAAGGGVACTGGSSPLVDNSAETSGGTINCALGSTPYLFQCTVSGGSGAVGSGVASWDAPGLTMTGVILVDGLTGRAWDGDWSSTRMLRHLRQRRWRLGGGPGSL